MLNIIKKYIQEFISKRIEYYFDQKFSIKNKWGVIIENSSSFQTPLQIDGGQYISIGANSSIGKHAWLGAFSSYLPGDSFSPKITIGNNVRVGNYACITCISNIVINDGVLISEHFYVSDHSHGMNPDANDIPINQPLSSKKNGVVIGENCFIGYRVSILPGVILGRNCIVGSHSVVTKSFPDYCMIAGIPAKIIKIYDFEKKDWL